VGDGEVEVELEVTDKLLNPYKTLHGGATCTLVDLVGTLAIITKDPTKAGASVELNVR
jgi:acyl-coenzyme A thioesterase 13